MSEEEIVESDLDGDSDSCFPANRSGPEVVQS